MVDRLIEAAGAKQVVLTMGKNMKPEMIVKLLDFNGKWKITGTTLRIDMKALGFEWIEGLKESLLALSKGKMFADARKENTHSGNA